MEDDRTPNGAPTPRTSPERAPVEVVCEGGAWVEIESVILTADERSGALPDDTRKHPFIGRTRGFLTDAARVGDRVAVDTLIGRRVEGRLRRAMPRNPADFGDPAPELLALGQRARRRLEGRPA